MKQCHHCGKDLKLTLTPEKIHYGRLDCPECKKFYGWEAKPAAMKQAFRPKIQPCIFCGKAIDLVSCQHCKSIVCENCAYEFGDILLCPTCGEKEIEETKERIQ